MQTQLRDGAPEAREHFDAPAYHSPQVSTEALASGPQAAKWALEVPGQVVVADCTCGESDAWEWDRVGKVWKLRGVPRVEGGRS